MYTKSSLGGSVLHSFPTIGRYSWLLAEIFFGSSAGGSPAAADMPTIVGGDLAAEGDWPWQAHLSTNIGNCGGVLIHRQWVVTAAHCLDQGVSTVHVTLGELDRSTVSGHEQVFTSTVFKYHTLFTTSTYDYDIGLVFLSEPATLNEWVQTIPLVAEDEAHLEDEGTIAWTTGWGATQEGGWLVNELREVDVPVYNHADCQNSYHDVTERQICAGYAQGLKDSCGGDSGGPLVGQNDSGAWKLLGLTSYGRGCARPNLPGVYTRVSQFRDWIGVNTSVVPRLISPMWQDVSIPQKVPSPVMFEITNTSGLTASVSITLELTNLDLVTGTTELQFLPITTMTEFTTTYVWTGEIFESLVTTQKFYLIDEKNEGTGRVCVLEYCLKFTIAPRYETYLPLISSQ